MSLPRSDRRALLAGLGFLGLSPVIGLMTNARAAPGRAYPVAHSDAQWRALLTAEQFRILRRAATEAPWTSRLVNEHRRGRFHCAGDGQALFSSAAKFESGTGWPSFTRALPGSVGYSSDRLLGYERTEVHCSRCGGHLGHVFNDGPAPTGKRFCINGAVLTFAPA